MRRFFPLLFTACAVSLLLAACSDDNGNTVDPPTVDTEKPTVSFVLPQDNASVKGDQIAVELTANDNTGVVKITLHINNGTAAALELTTAPWKGDVPLSGITPGTHTLTARASDAAGNVSDPAVVTITVVDKDLLAMQLIPGTEFVYDRWDIDETNQILQTSKRTYTSKIIAGTGEDLKGKTDWVYNISLDAQTQKYDTLIFRLDEDGNVMVYGFFAEIMRKFIEKAGATMDIGNPVLPEAEWEYVGKFNAQGGAALPVGTEWDITKPAGYDFSITVFGFPVNVNVVVKGIFENRGDVITVSGKDIPTWSSKITATVTIVGTTLDIVIRSWFSDDPDGMIRLRQDGALLDLGLTSFPVEGELRELVSYQ